MPLDTRIALSGQPIQLESPLAQYGQLMSVMNAGSQNQLAQMQMQEHQQMAPYRMQEAQTRAASAKLTYDQAKQAQDFITSVMTKAAEHPEAPQDPIEAAQQMLLHPNPQVQAVGGHMLDATQKLMTYKQQQAWLKSQNSTVENLPVAPNAIAENVNNVGAEMNAPSGLATSLYPEQIANRPINFYKKGAVASSLIELPDNQITYRLNEKEVPFSDYVNANIATNAGAGEAAAMATMPNKLAPAVNPKPVVNALVAPTAPAPAPAKASAESVMAQIAAGDRKYGEAKGWLSQRALLVDQAKELLKNPVMHVVDNNLVDPNGNVVFKGTPDMHFEKQVNADGTETILAIDKKKGTYTPVTQNGVAVAGVNPTIKAAQLRIDAEANKPAAKGSFEQMLDLANLDPDARQKMIMAKLAHDTAPPSQAADSQFERTMTALNLPEAQKNALRRQLLAKETRIPSEGGAGGERLPVGSMLVIDPADPTGKKIITVTTARAIKEGLIPASTVAKEEKLKPIPANINTAISTNDLSIRQIQEALDMLKKNPDAIGLKNVLPGQMLDRADPKGVAVRSAVGNIGSLVIHERSGSAVTGSEMQRLGFIPTPTDRADAAKTKLEAMLKWAKAQQEGLTQTYGEDQGYRPNPTLSGKNAAPAAKPATVSNW